MTISDEAQKILRKRALTLSKEISTSDEDDQYIEVTEFYLATEWYGIETCYISEVHQLDDFTELPCTPDFVFGIMNIRGEIISVIDIKKFFGLPQRGISDLNKVIVLKNEGMKFGILVDEILGVSHISVNNLKFDLPTLTDIRSDYLMGVTIDRLTVLDGGKLLNNNRVIVHEEVSL